MNSQLTKKSPPRKHPRWRQPGRHVGQESHTESPLGSSQQAQNFQAFGVESIQISDIFLLVRTPEGQFYGEFHGQFNDSDFPDELLHDESNTRHEI